MPNPLQGMLMQNRLPGGHPLSQPFTGNKLPPGHPLSGKLGDTTQRANLGGQGPQQWGGQQQPQPMPLVNGRTANPYAPGSRGWQGHELRNNTPGGWNSSYAPGTPAWYNDVARRQGQPQQGQQQPQQGQQPGGGMQRPGNFIDRPGPGSMRQPGAPGGRYQQAGQIVQHVMGPGGATYRIPGQQGQPQQGQPQQGQQAAMNGGNAGIGSNRNVGMGYAPQQMSNYNTNGLQMPWGPMSSSVGMGFR